MIFYFSGTGNSRWAAQKIAALTNDEAFDIIQCTDVPDVTHETQIGLVFPIYAWGAPEPVLTFVKKIHRKTQFYIRRLHLRRRSRACHEKIFALFSSGQQLQFGHAEQLYHRRRCG